MTAKEAIKKIVKCFFTDDSENIIYLSDIGKTVFLTREEAERALKERENNA